MTKWVPRKIISFWVSTVDILYLQVTSSDSCTWGGWCCWIRNLSKVRWPIWKTYLSIFPNVERSNPYSSHPLTQITVGFCKWWASYRASHVLVDMGWVDLNLGSSPGWWAATVATYCPSRVVDHPKSKSTTPSLRGHETPWGLSYKMWR